MTKSDIVVQLQQIIGEEKVSKSEADRIWNAVVEMITEEVKNGGEVKIGGLAKFYKKDKKARKVRNPKTGETSMKPACSALACRVLSEGKKIFEK